jgi:hypothetical protein
MGEIPVFETGENERRDNSLQGGSVGKTDKGGSPVVQGRRDQAPGT